MNARLAPHLLAALLSVVSSATVTAQTTAFTYQWRLTDGGNPASGDYDLEFTLHDAASGGSLVAGPLTNSPVTVSNGLFTAALDFGADVFDGAERWLEIGVRPGGTSDPFVLLSPRQHLASSPYAIRAGSVDGANITGLVPNNRLPGNLLRSDVPLIELENEVLFHGPVIFDNPSGAPFSVSSSPDMVLGLNAEMLGNRSAAGFWQTEGNTGTTPGANFIGTTDNQPLELKVNHQRALRIEPTTGAPNLVGGGADNVVEPGATGATIAGGNNNRSGHVGDAVGGGYWNQAVGGYSTVAGGEGNTASGYHAMVGGGQLNMATNRTASVVGGLQNLAAGEGSFVGGGRGNNAADDYTMVAGGQYNVASNFYAAIGGGLENEATALAAAIAGGRGNAVSGDYAAILGGVSNQISATSFAAAIAGGQSNRVNGAFATVGGGKGNLALADGATIGGGALRAMGWTGNLVSDNLGTIGGGAHNQAGDDTGGTDTAEFATVGGGFNNTASGKFSFVGGGLGNQAGGTNAAIAGGEYNFAQAMFSFIGGGGPVTDIPGFWAAYGNSVTDDYGTVGGGSWNQAGNDDFDPRSAMYGTVPGGRENQAGAPYTFAAGRRAKALHQGAFVWADARDVDYTSTRPNEFNIRATGGVRIDTDSGPGVNLNAADRPLITRGHDPFSTGNYQGAGRWGLFMEPHTLIAGIPALAGKSFRISTYDADSSINKHLMTVDQAGTVTATTFNPTSDRHAKENFAHINPAEVLEKVATLPLSRWDFKQDPGAEHVGPMAQDFHAAFRLGTDDKHIATVDADGVALAAIQGLNEKVELGRQQAELWSRELQQQLEQKDTKIAELESELGQLKRLMIELSHKLDGGAQ